MIKFSAKYYDGNSASSQEVNVSLVANELIVQSSHEKFHFFTEKLNILPRLGSTRREIKILPDGLIQTDDHVAVEALEKALGANQKMSLVSRLESCYKSVIISLILIFVIMYAAVRFGIPAFAKDLSQKIDQPTLTKVSEGAMSFLDRIIDESKLENERKVELTKKFNYLAQKYGDKDYNYQLEFRRMGETPNAFALPDGTIVLFDGLESDVERDQEIEAVFLHEIAHVKYRHGMQGVIKKAGIAFLLSAWLGDISGISELPTLLASSLIESKYSQEFELEADTYAARCLIAEFGDADAMKEALMHLHDVEEQEEAKDSKFDIISTHPGLKTRLENIDTVTKNR